MQSSLSLRRLRGEQGLSSLYSDWLQLMGSITRQCFYHHPAWFRAFYHRGAGADDGVELCAVYRDDALIAVLPLTCTRHAGGFVRASLAQGEGLYMPDCAITDTEDKAALWQFLRRSMRWDVFSVRDTLATSTIAQCLALENRFTRVAQAGGRCAVVDIIPHQATLRALKKKFRGNLNNAKHRLARQDEVEFLRITAPNELDAAFAAFVELEQSGWKGKLENTKENYTAPAAIALKHSKLNFYRTVVHEFGRCGAVEICLLRVNGKTIGGQILLCLNHVSYLLKTAYDEDAREFSPGHLLIDHTLERYSRGGQIRELNLISDYDWFRPWNPRYVPYLSVHDFSRTVGGLLGSTIYRTTRSIRELERTTA